MRFLIAGLLLFFLLIGAAQAGPRGIVEKGGVKITLYSEACTLTDIVSNLPAKITWEEGDKLTEGCYTIGFPEFGYLVIIYFMDKTVVLMPLMYFKPLTPA